MISTILFYAGLVLFVIGFLIALKHAFKVNTVWAIAMLLIPVLVIIHFILFWKDLPVRKALYVMIVAIITTGVGIFGGALAEVPNIPHNSTVDKLKQSTVPEQKPLPNEQQADAIELPEGENYDPVLSGSTFEEADIQPLPPKEDKTITPVAMITRTLRSIDMDMIPYTIDRKVQLMLDGDQLETGVVSAVNEEGVILDQSTDQGLVQFTYVFSRIKSVEAMLSEDEFENARLQADQAMLKAKEVLPEETVDEIDMEIVSPEIRIDEIN